MNTKLSRKLWHLALLGAGFHVYAQNWTQTSAPNAYWGSIASSADGTHLIAAAQSAGSGIYISTNSGATWNRASTGLPTGTVGWLSVASSADGQKFVAARYDTGGIYLSGDSGATWMAANVPAETWQALAMSADGSIITAVSLYDTSHSNPGPIYISTNSGSTWKSAGTPTANWRKAASSADGNKLIAVGATGGIGPIYISTNAGSSWNLASSAPFANWFSVAASLDGTKFIVCNQGGAIYTNSGTGWIQNNSLASANILFPAISADGNTLAMAAYNGGIYTSTNGGTTWITGNAPVQKWESVVVSADGTKMAAACFGGGIYTCQTTPAPALNVNTSTKRLNLSWIVPSTNFVLQQSADLISWMNVTSSAVLNTTNLQNQVSLSFTNSNGFFRLITP
jgi:hypothetical protein